MRLVTFTVALFLTAGPCLLAQSPRIVSPDIQPDGRVVFRLNAPKSAEVILTGEFLDGPRKMERGSDGIWSRHGGTRRSLRCTTTTSRSTACGRSIRRMPQLKTGSTASTITSVLEVRASVAGVLRRAAGAARRDPHALVSLEVARHAYGGSRCIRRRVTTRARAARYPVLYLFHGANADENAWYRLGRGEPHSRQPPCRPEKSNPSSSSCRSDTACRRVDRRRENTAKFSKDLIEDVIPLYRVSACRAHA